MKQFSQFSIFCSNRKLDQQSLGFSINLTKRGITEGQEVQAQASKSTQFKVMKIFAHMFHRSPLGGTFGTTGGDL